MLSLKVNGEAVELPDDFSVTSNLKSPIFNEVGSYSYPFKFRNSPRNSKIIGFLHRQEGTRDPFVSAPSQLLWNGCPFEETVIKYTQIDADVIEGTMLQAEGSFFNAIKERMMRAVNTGEMVFPSETVALDYINWCTGRFYPETTVCFPEIWNPDYFDPVTEDPEQEYYNYRRTDPPANNKICAWTNQNNRTVIIPFLFLRHVLVSIFKDAGYKLSDSMFTKHADYSKLVVYNSLTCNSLLTDFTYTLVDIFTGMHLPNMAVSDFLTGIETHFNCRFFIDNTMKNARCISVDDILKSTDHIEFSDRIEKVSSDLTTHKTGFLFKMSLDSDDTALDSSSSIEDIFVGRINPSVEKVSDLPQFPYAEIGEIRFVESANEFYNLSSLTKTWAAAPILKSYIFSQFLFRDFSEKIDSKFSSLGLIEAPDEVMCKNKLSEWNNISPRIFFTKYQNIEKPTMIGTSQTNNFGLFFNQNNNLYDLHYKAYFNWFMQARLVKVVKQMTFQELKSLDFSKKYRINGLDYLIKDVRVTFNRDKIKPATLEMYKV